MFWNLDWLSLRGLLAKPTTFIIIVYSVKAMINLDKN